jgi:tyrosinase
VKKKSRVRSSKTDRKPRILPSLPTNYAGVFNVYSRMALRIKSQIENTTLEVQTLPRVNQAHLEPAEKQQLIEAFETIIKNGQFADLVSIHSDAYRYSIHTGDTDIETNERFLPWHRVFLYELERRLNSTSEGNSKIRIPYWDWTVDREIPGWLEDFKPVIKKVPVFPPPPNDPIPEIKTISVERTPGELINPQTGRPFELPTTAQVDRLGDITNFRQFTAYLEGIHGLPHLWVGGTMAEYVSPADPIFWLHHSNIDRLWVLWPRSQSELPNLQGSSAEMTPWNYRTDADPIQDTNFFYYKYK